LLHGSWMERFSQCSRPGCKCHTGKRHGPRSYVIINDNGRQRQKYIPNSFVKTAHRGLGQYKRLQKIVDRITHINLSLMGASRVSVGKLLWTQHVGVRLLSYCRTMRYTSCNRLMEPSWSLDERSSDTKSGSNLSMEYRLTARRNSIFFGMAVALVKHTTCGVTHERLR